MVTVKPSTVANIPPAENKVEVKLRKWKSSNQGQCDSHDFLTLNDSLKAMRKRSEGHKFEGPRKKMT